MSAFEWIVTVELSIITGVMMALPFMIGRR